MWKGKIVTVNPDVFIYYEVDGNAPKHSLQSSDLLTTYGRDQEWVLLAPARRVCSK